MIPSNEQQPNEPPKPRRERDAVASFDARIVPIYGARTA